MQVPNGTWSGVRRSKRPLLASRTRCNVLWHCNNPLWKNYALWTPPKFGNKVKIGNKVQFGNKFTNWCHWGCHCIWSCPRIYYVLYINKYILYLFFFIYYCLYCLYHNLFTYIVSLYWITQSREINRANWWFMYSPIVAALPIWRHPKNGLFSC